MHYCSTMTPKTRNYLNSKSLMTETMRNLTAMKSLKTRNSTSLSLMTTNSNCSMTMMNWIAMTKNWNSIANCSTRNCLKTAMMSWSY